MSPDKNEDSNYKNYTFKYLSSYILFLTHCSNIDKNSQEKLLFLNKQSIYTNLRKKGNK